MLDAIYLLMHSNLDGAVNIGIPVYISVKELVELVGSVSGKKFDIKHTDGPVGVQSRNFSNAKMESLGWKVNYPVREGIMKTYPWILGEVEKAKMK